MKNFLILAVVVVGALLIAQERHNNFSTEDSLGLSAANISKDDSTKPTPLTFFYMGYVEGVEMSLDATNKICAPANVTQKEKALVVDKYLFDHPEKLHEPSFVNVLDALLKAYPCKRIKQVKR